MKIRRIGLVAAFAILPACDDTGSPDGAIMRVVSGAGATDTIGSGSYVLVVRLTQDGDPLAGETIVFTSAGLAPVELGIGGPGPAEGLTDGDGSASVLVRLGTRAGEAIVRATAPERDASVDAEYTILAGAAAEARILSSDTALRIGGSFDVRAIAVDRGDNPATGSVVVDVVTPGVLDLEGQATVEGLEIGAGIVVARFGETGADTLRVSVVPPGLRLVAVAPAGQGDALVTVDLDGRDARTLQLLPPTSDGVAHPDWNPEMHRVAYELPHASGRSIRAVDVNAERGALIDPETFQHAAWPQYSADGAWLFFAGRDAGDQPVRVWRASDEGVAPTPLSPLDFPHHVSAPSPAPAADRVAFAADDSVRVLIVESEAQHAIASGSMPRWSPDGGRIAFIDDGSVWLIDPDGNDRVRLTAAGTRWSDEDLDWSNDSEWLIARSLDEGVLFVIEIATGAALPLGYTTGWSQPAFAPALP